MRSVRSKTSAPRDAHPGLTSRNVAPVSLAVGYSVLIIDLGDVDER